MKIFASRGYRLAALPWGARLFYTLFLVFVLLGLVSCLGYLFAKSGTTTAQIAEYYTQEELGLGGKPFLELLETAHFHLFSMPMFFLVLGHIFFLSSWPEKTKLFVILVAFVALVFEVVLPFLIVYHSPAWTWMKHVSRFALFGTFLVFVVVPIRDMWGPDAGTDPASRI